MSNVAVDGLISGLDTTNLVNQLMQVEAAPQTLLKNKSSQTSRFVTALQALNTKVANLADAAKKAAGRGSWDVHTVTSSSDAVTATAGTGAQPATLQLRVNHLASAQVSMVDTGAEAFGAGHITIARGEELHTVSTTGDIHDIAKAINAAEDLGIKAVAVRVTNGAGGDPQYRLQLSGTTGADNAFTVHAGTADDVRAHREAGTTPPNLDDVVVRAADAKVTLWPGADGTGIELTSATNTFTAVMPGVDFTAHATTGDVPVTLTVAQDTEAQQQLATGLVDAVKAVLTDITTRTATTTTTDNDGRTVVTGGLFSGDSAVRFLADQLRSAVTTPDGTRSPSEVGLSIDRYGAVTFDQATFDAAMAADPEGTQAFVAALAQRVADVATNASDKHEGSLTTKITSQESQVADIDRQIADWDRRLELRREGLMRTYSALEVTLGQLQSQSSWLAGQLSSLPSMSQGS